MFITGGTYKERLDIAEKVYKLLMNSGFNQTFSVVDGTGTRIVTCKEFRVLIKMEVPCASCGKIIVYDGGPN